MVMPAGRPAWRARGREQAEDFFVDALSAWHKELGLGKMILLGHSLGGYLAATYALRHPEDVEHLILVCPAGMVSNIALSPNSEKLIILLPQGICQQHILASA